MTANLLYPAANTVPHSVALEVQSSCNLSCCYCYGGNLSNAVPEPVPPDFTTVSSIIERLAEAGVSEVLLIGGEPTSCPDLPTICNAVAQAPFTKRGIVTNGTCITEDLADLFESLNFSVDVTFRAPTASVFDDLARRPGAFLQALRGIQVLSRHNICIGLEYDCHPLNYHLLFQTAAMLLDKHLRLDHIWLHRIAPYGRAERCHSDQLSIPQYRDVFRQAARIEGEFEVRTFFEDRSRYA